MECISHSFADKGKSTELSHVPFHCATSLTGVKPRFTEAADGHTSNNLIIPISQMKKRRLSSIQ